MKGSRRLDSRCVTRTALAISILVLLLLWARAPLAEAIRQIDRNWLDERLMDTLARLRGNEDWSRPAPLRVPQDYRWLAGERPLRIAHALGESGLPTANTVGAMRRSYDDGLRVFEVDLVLEGGRLICQHDPSPEEPAPVAGKAPTDAAAAIEIAGDGADRCTLDRLIDALPLDAWVILDLKTDFEPAAEAALAVARRAGRVDRLVFQLYAPAQVDRFSAWQRVDSALPGPLITTYLAHRSLKHIVAAAHRLGIRALTLPTSRWPALPQDRKGESVFVHPVHDCASMNGYRTDGHYTLRTLNCSPSAQSPAPLR